MELNHQAERDKGKKEEKKEYEMLEERKSLGSNEHNVSSLLIISYL